MNKQITKSLEKIAKHQARIHAIRESCPHPEETLTAISKSDTGNWCKADDSWWTEYSCADCGKMWAEDK